jgi:hypothetical protein
MSWVVDGVDGLQVCRVVANTLNEQFWTTDKELGKGLTTPHFKKSTSYEMLQRASKWTDSLEQPRQWKMDMRFGAWNVIISCGAGTLKTVASKMVKHNLDLMPIKEVRWGEVNRQPEIEIEMLIIS